MMANLYHSSKRMYDIHIALYDKGVKAHDHPYFEDILLNWKMDLIILEYTSWFTVASKLKSIGVTTPVVTVNSFFIVQ